jgi:transitional endoplasmic reticulum ATPase
MKPWKISATENELTTFTGSYDLVSMVQNSHEYEFAQALSSENRPIRRQDTIDLAEPERSKWETYIATQAVYQPWIADVVERLSMHRSVLCVCDKPLARPLYRQMEGWALVTHKTMTFTMVGNIERMHLQNVRQDFEEKMISSAANQERVVVVPHLDLIAAGDYAQELALYLSEYPQVTVLAFCDPGIPLSPAIHDLLAERRELPGITREQVHLLIRPEEARRLAYGCLEINDQIRLFQLLSGMNVIQIRRLMTWLYQTTTLDLTPSDSTDRIYEKIREFTSGTQPDAFGGEPPDLAGYDEVMTLLMENVIEPLDQRAKVSDGALVARYDQVTPRGVLLYGPPRNGKTEFARWLAHKLRAPLIVVRGPELKNMYHGETERAIRRVFAQARRSAPSVILIDEIDSLTPTRSNRSDDVTISTVSTLLTEMDGLGREESILVIGTTNRFKAVDPAFLAPGRFSLQVLIDYPTPERSAAIINYYDQKWGLHLSEKTKKAIVAGATGYLDPKAETERERLRDALLSNRFSEQALKIGGDALIKMVDAELDPQPKWSCDHLRGVMQRFLLQSLQNGQAHAKVRSLDDPDFIRETLAIVRGDTSALLRRVQRVQPSLGKEL